MVLAANSQFWRSFNIFKADFGHIKSSLQCTLFKQYCCSFYGAPLWQLRSKEVKTTCTSWRKALRNIWRINCRTHCDIVAMLSDCLPLEDALKHRFQKFHDNISKKGNNFLRMVVSIASRNPFSVYYDNLKECQRFQEDSKNICFDRKLSFEVKVNALKELIDIRDRISVCNALSLEEVNEMIDSLCIL